MVDEQLSCLFESRSAEQSCGTANGSMLMVEFVATRFIPNHVQLKSPAGRTHYQAILKHVFTPGLIDRLFARYGREVNGRLEPVFGWPYLDHLKISDVSPNHIRRLIDFASARGYSHQTVKHIRNVVGAIFIHARREKVFNGDNPVSEVRLEAPSMACQPRVSLIQANAILNLMSSPEREIAMITITTGLRIPEICALQWKHINLSRNRTYIRGVCIPPGFLLVTQQWSGNWIADNDLGRIKGIPISDLLSRALTKMRQQKAVDSESFLISDSDGRPIPPAAVRPHQLKATGRKLGLSWVSWSALREAHKTHGQELKPRIGDSRIFSVRLPESAPDLELTVQG